MNLPLIYVFRLFGITLFLCVSVNFADAIILNYQVSGAQKELVGTSSIVVGSGNPSQNYNSSTAVGDFAVFDIVAVDDLNGGTVTDFADLKVTYLSDNGGSGSNVMIARTTDSQGLTDAGTISIILQLNVAGGDAAFQFDWYAPDSFIGGVEQNAASLLNTPINYTTFDIDYRQKVVVEKSGLQSYTLNDNSAISVVDDGSAISFEDDGSHAVANDPEAAVQFVMNDMPASHVISVGKQVSGGPALFMFEFRNPSEVVVFTDPVFTAVPEPSSMSFLMGGLALFWILGRRRRV